MELGAINDEEREAWVRYEYPDEDGNVVKTDTDVLLAFITPERLNLLGERAKKTVWINHQEQKVFDANKHHKLIGREVVKNWRRNNNDNKIPESGFSVKGEPFPHSTENCDLMMKVDFNFIKFVNDNCTEMSNFIHKERSDAKKKSKNTVSG